MYQARDLVKATLTPATMGVSFTTKTCHCGVTPEERRKAAKYRSLGQPRYACPVCNDTRKVSEYKWAKHILAMDKKLVELAQRKIKRLMFLLPPRHGKSELASHWFVNWYFTRFPTHKVGVASYGGAFSAEWGSKVRDFWYTYGDELNNPVRGGSASDFSLASGARMISTGVGGSLTGKGLNLLIIDDPIKNHKEALSPVIRQSHKDWYQTTSRSRLEPDGKRYRADHYGSYDSLAPRRSIGLH